MPLFFQQGFGGAIAGLLFPIGAQGIATMVPNDGGRIKPYRPCSENLGFSEAQVEMLLTTIREANGNRFLGDDLSELPQDRLEKYV